MKKQRTFKKTLSLLLAAAILIACVPVFSVATAANETSPIILVSGFGATKLIPEGESGLPSFPPSTDDILGILKNNGLQLINGILSLAGIGNGNLRAAIYGVIEEVAEPLRMNPDGTSYYNMVPVLSGAKNTSLKAFKETDNLENVPYTGSEFLDMEIIGKEIGDENVFNFLFDWRKSHTEIAVEFNEYINEVKALTGSKKVSVYSISQGAFVVGAYLNKYGGASIDSTVFDTPTLGGSSLFTDLMNPNGIDISWDTALELVRNIIHTELDFSKIAGIIPADTFSTEVRNAVQEVVVPIIKYVPAFWEIMPIEDFDELSGEYLSSQECALLLEKIETMHSGFTSNVTKTFSRAEREGADVFVVACYGSPVATGTKNNSDGIVDVKYSCGAFCAPLGETFLNSYVQQGATDKYSISPNRTVDVSTGYWPQRTWLVNRHLHGQVEWNPQTLSLIMKMLLTNEVTDAYSMYDYPQFMESSAPSIDIAISFKCTNSSFLTYDKKGFSGKSLVVKNVSQKDGITVSGITVSGGSLQLLGKFPLYLDPGQSVEIGFSGKTPSLAVYDSIEISYKRTGLLSQNKTLSFGITIFDDYAGVIKTDLRSAQLVSVGSGINYLCYYIVKAYGKVSLLFAR